MPQEAFFFYLWRIKPIFFPAFLACFLRASFFFLYIILIVKLAGVGGI